MKKFTALFIVLSLLSLGFSSCLTVYTDTVELSDYLFTYEIRDDNTVKITGTDVGFGKIAVIPSEIHGLPVSSI